MHDKPSEFIKREGTKTQSTGNAYSPAPKEVLIQTSVLHPSERIEKN